MKLSTFTTLITLSGLAAAQISQIPSCALPCFQKAIAKTDCGLNTYCQCTTGSKVIQSSVIKCLCDTNACSASELEQLTKASNKICSAALASSSQTYSAATLPANACQTGGAGSTGTASSATTTGTNTATTGTAAAASSGSSSSSGRAAPTNAAMLGYECAALGLAGMALFGL